jgi:hypothetical protein
MALISPWHIASSTVRTLRVLTPWKYISEQATNSARSLRSHLPKRLGVIRLTAAYLRHVQLQLAHPRLELARLASVAMPFSILASLVPIGADVLAHLLLHRPIRQPLNHLFEPLLLFE